MSQAEARKMSPEEESSGPESASRIKSESSKEAVEAKRETAGDRFLNDAHEYAVLNAKAEAKRLEMKEVERKIPLGLMTQEAKANLEAETKTMYSAMDKIADTYGADAWSFRFDAMNLGELNAKIERMKSRLAEVSKMDAKDWPGGEKGYDNHTDMLMKQIARLGGEATTLEQKLKENYDKTEADRRADVSSISDAEIDTLLLPLEEKAMDVTEAQFMAKGEAIGAENERTNAIIQSINEGRTVEVQDEWLSEPEAEALVKKNELSPDRKTLLQADLEGLRTELFDLKTGLLEAEDELRKYGEHPDALSEAKDSAALAEAFKKETSYFSRLKRGVKFLTSSGYRKALDNYNRKSEAIAEVRDEIARTELALKDPLKAADLAARRVLRNLVRNAAHAKDNKPRGILSM